MDENGKLKSTLTSSQLYSLNQSLKDSEIKTQLDNNYEKCIEYLASELDNYAPTSAEAIEEILFIQTKLSDEEYVGYVFTNEVAKTKKHFEIYIISNQSIIHPLEWKVDVDQTLALPLYQSKIPYYAPLILNKVPQAGTVECGTLGLKYLKELLKNNCEQLNKYTLFFRYYRNKDKMIWHAFIPSPQVLRYSQSGFYNVLTKATIEEQEKTVVKYKEQTIEITPLEKILEDSISYARQEESEINRQIAQENIYLLEKLQQGFRDEWLEAYKVSEMQRDSMNDEEKQQNTYLLYATTQYLEFVESKDTLSDKAVEERVRALEEEERVRALEEERVRALEEEERVRA